MFDGASATASPSPLEIETAQEWQAAQLAQKHVGQHLQQILDAWRADRAEIARLTGECERLRKQLTLAGAQLASLGAKPDYVGFDATKDA